MISKRNSKNSVALSMILLSCLMFSLISMTGCQKHYIVVDGSEVVTITKQELDRLYSDNEMCLKALIGKGK